MTTSDLNTDLYQLTTRVHRHIGFQKIRMGAMLCVLEDTGDWRGRAAAQTFRGFLLEEGIHPQAARQYMKVARRFILELEISKDDLLTISRASMRVLCAAAEVASEENLAELIDLIATLPRPEAMEEIKVRYGYDDRARPQVPEISRPVGKILSDMGELTHLQRAELFSRLGLGTAGVPASHALD
ncbi:hypothetical protein [Noviherbaspirillum galbum]|uniref:Uncharacterized protein n=1 Tax=Noviherbaspirillum galbum TaxID=2709383 RepID=A0A6B3SR22_9BURK|nr:hypothetical protein [Noviherbaspirillum galbum]NEX63091.1 hypothetical protein [Noviherbaspirillum galbum]